MRVIYQPYNEKIWEHFFKVQAAQSGHGLSGYRGTAYQRGAGFGSLVGGLLRSFLPVAKNIGKAVGKQALRTGVEVAADALSGRNLGEALEERGKAGAFKLVTKAGKKLKPTTGGGQKKKRKTQRGRGLGYRPRKTTATALPKAVSRAKRVHRDQLGAYLAPE